jgi:hypothetical protein
MEHCTWLPGHIAIFVPRSSLETANRQRLFQNTVRESRKHRFQLRKEQAKFLQIGQNPHQPAPWHINVYPSSAKAGRNVPQACSQTPWPIP